MSRLSFTTRLPIIAVVAVLAAGLLVPRPVAAMTFQAVQFAECRARQCFAASGPIEKASLGAFRAFVSANKLSEGAILFLDSEGGDIVAGIALGREVRKRGFDTFVAGADPLAQGFRDADCASACVFVFAGGVQRGAGERSRLGVHQVIVTGQVSPAESAISAQLFMGMASEQLLEMGVDPQLMSLALKTPASSIRWISRQEMRGTKAITLDTGVHLTDPRLGGLSFFDATR